MTTEEEENADIHRTDLNKQVIEEFVEIASQERINVPTPDGSFVPQNIMNPEYIRTMINKVPSRYHTAFVEEIHHLKRLIEESFTAIPGPQGEMYRVSMTSRINAFAFSIAASSSQTRDGKGNVVASLRDSILSNKIEKVNVMNETAKKNILGMEGE